MKKIIYILLVSITIFSCEKSKVEDEITQAQIDQLAEQRTQEKINELNSKLLSSKNGWYADYEYSKDKTPVPLYFSFKDKNKVLIQSPVKGFESKESSYTLSYTKQVDLLFDNNSVIVSHVEEFKRGFLKWQLVAINENEIIFKNTESKKEDESFLTLRKSDGSHSTKIKNIIKAQISLTPKLSHDPAASYYRNLEITGVNHRYAFSFDENSFSLVFTNQDKKGNKKYHRSQVLAVSEDKFTLEKPLYVNGIEVKDFMYDSASKKFNIENSELKGSITYGSKVLTNEGAADAFLKQKQKSFIFKDPSPAFKQLLEGVLKIEEIIGVQWFVNRRNDNVIAFALKTRLNDLDLAFNIYEGHNKIGEDIISLKKDETVINIKELASKNKILNDFMAFMKAVEGFDIVPYENNGSFIVVSRADPKFYFRLESAKKDLF